MGKIVSFEAKGDFRKTYRFLEKIKEFRIQNLLNQYGAKGVDILSANTPVKTGKTASSWSYETNVSNDSISIEWYNSSLANDEKTPVVILIIKGHGTRNGGYVPPNDFVEPLMEDLFAEAADAVWKVVTSL